MKAMTPSDTPTIADTYRKPFVWPKPEPKLTHLERHDELERSAAKECLSTYGNAVWIFSKEYTRSLQEAEVLACEIFQDIWVYGDADRDARLPDDMTIKQIAIRRLFKHKNECRNQL